MKAFEEGLRSLGYRVGETVAIEYRFANGDMERLPALALAQAGFLLTYGADIADAPGAPPRSSGSST
jgi:hypothetical protein